jgi:hypothetical protein
MSTTPLERLICADCGHRLWSPADRRKPCPDCEGELRRMGPFEAFVDRWFAPPDMHASDMHRRHMQLVELLWTADDRGTRSSTQSGFRTPRSSSGSTH